jgi:hypothetical protein
MGNEIFKAMAATYPFGWCHDHNAFFYANIDLIADVELRIREHALGNAKSLTISPFLDFCKHYAPPHV